MSEFECACGNLIRPSVGRCELCGGRAVRMDGMTARQLAYEEEGRRSNENGSMVETRTSSGKATD